ncbi:hypothetical protein SAMN05428966_10896 [Massilia sp. PDC64]|nr:hypothetical protein SAMN05428966_10896 [Massilia sp. PDC64]
MSAVKISTSKFIQFIVASTCIGLYLYVEWMALHSAYMRYFYLSTAVIMIAGTVLLSWLKLRELRALNGDALKRKMRTEKWVAELSAAVAVIAFAGVFFREGYQFDKNNWQARFNEIAIASRTLQENLPRNFCVSKPNLVFSCADVVEKLNASVQAIPPDGSEKDFGERLDRVKSMVSTLIASSSGKQRAALLSVQDNIDAAKMNSEALDFMLRTLALLLFLGAISAVSRKVAIAWRERDENVNGDSPPEQPEPQQHRPLALDRLVALAPSQSISSEHVQESTRDNVGVINMGPDGPARSLRALPLLLFLGTVAAVTCKVVLFSREDDETIQ